MENGIQEITTELMSINDAIERIHYKEKLTLEIDACALYQPMTASNSYTHMFHTHTRSYAIV